MSATKSQVTLAEWEKSPCACVNPDARECARIRDGHSRADIQYDYNLKRQCECVCHSEFEGDDDDDF